MVVATAVELDPITLEVVNNRLREIVSTMERLLFHSGYSTILRESYDGSAGITDPTGRAVMSSGMPVHLFPYYYTVQGVLKQYPLEEMREGDSFVLNDPYLGGNLHVPDVAIVTPIFYDGAVFGFCVSIAHKPDLGGLVPGSSGAGARELYHEGLLMPGVRYWTREGIVKEVDLMIRRNSRTPSLVAGDLRAQVGCTRVGARKVQELCDEYSADTIRYAFDKFQSLSEQRMRTELRAWPDGESEAEGWLDSDGVDLKQPVRIHARICKEGESITFDFSGTGEQVKGPVNIRPQAAESAAMLALMTYLDPTIPINDGCRRVMTFVNPEGRLTNPRHPAPVNNYYGVTHVLYSCILKALVHFKPQRAVGPAGFGIGGNSLGYRRARAGKPAVQYEILVSSLGATPVSDGAFVVMAMSHITPNTPIEILETEFPVRVERFEPMVDSCGPGYNRGGIGYRKQYRVLDDAIFTLRMGQFRFGAWGVLGGQGPTLARCVLNAGTPSEEVTPPLLTREVTANDTIAIELPGGGGYGDPHTREPERVLEDVLNGYVSVEAAERQYGVAIDLATCSIDGARTRQLRQKAAGESVG